jgi:hypothetical protein
MSPAFEKRDTRDSRRIRYPENQTERLESMPIFIAEAYTIRRDVPKLCHTQLDQSQTESCTNRTLRTR